MTKHFKYIYLLLILFCHFQVFGNVDSLNAVLNSSKSDSEKVELLNTISSLHKNNSDSSLFFASKALKISLELKNYKQIVNSYLSLSNTYQDIGDFNNSLLVLFKAQNIADSINDQELLGKTNNNLGNVYRGIEDIPKAEKFYNAAIEAYKLANSELELGKTYNNLGLVYARQKKLDEAILAYEQSIQVTKKFDDKTATSNGYSNLGVAYYYKGDVDKTIYYFEKSLEIDRSLNNRLGVAISLSNIGELYLEIGKVEEALQNLKKSVDYSIEVNAQDLLKHTYMVLSQTYEKKHDYQMALQYYQKHSNLKDSLVGLEKSKYALELENQYEASEKEKKILELEKLKVNQELELSQKKATQNLLIGCGLIIGLLLVIFINRYNAKRKANETLKLYTSQIEEKNTEITDSIVYAKRIQAAILPSDKLLKKLLANFFIFYKPKDIVAGDFYWMETIDSSVLGVVSDESPSHFTQHTKLILFAVADCTGHGVPGAMVSVVCNNALNRSVREHGLSEPGLILDKTREIVIQEFEKSDEVVNDGMDIALCSLKYNVQSENLQKTKNKKQTTAILQYAGANNPLWIVREGKLIEFKATKQPIGKYQKPKSFKTHTIEVFKDDVIYLFSDGFADQFGGTNGKKFKSSQLKSMLLSIQHETMDKQHDIINTIFNSWKGGSDQIDDVCILGIKI